MPHPRLRIDFRRGDRVESARQNREIVVAEIIDVTVELPITQQQVRDLLVDPQVYPRICAGIGACEQVDAPDGRPMWQFRIGTPEVGVRLIGVTVRSGRGADFEVQCPQTGSFAVIRLRGEHRTRVAITYFAPGRVHPVIAAQSNSAIVDWTRRALQLLADLVAGTPSSVVCNGENSPLRSRMRVARRVASTGVVGTLRPVRSAKQLGEVAKWGFNLAGGYAGGAAYSPIQRYLTDLAPAPRCRSLDELIDLGTPDFQQPARPGRLIVLTSGTSGTPKGPAVPIPRDSPRSPRCCRESRCG